MCIADNFRIRAITTLRKYSHTAAKFIMHSSVLLVQCNAYITPEPHQYCCTTFIPQSIGTE